MKNRGPLLTGKRITPEGQLATVTTQAMDTADTEAVLTPAATLIEAEIAHQRTDEVVKTEVTVPSVFPETKKSIEKPDLLPTKFQGILPTRTVSEVSAGSIETTPALGTGEISETQEQITVHKKRVTTASRDVASLPKEFTEYVVTPEGQVATRTLKAAVGAQTLTADATTLSGEVEDIGDGTTILTKVDAPSVFPQGEKSKSIPDLLPQKFAGAVPTVEEVVTSEGTIPTGEVTLGTDELQKTEQQVTIHKKRVSTRKRASVTKPVPVVESRLTPEGQVATITQVYNTEAATTGLIGAATTIEGQIEKLGDGNAIKTEVTVDSVFSQGEKSKSIPDLIPDKFKGVVPTVEEAKTEEGQISTEEINLASGELSKTEQQVTANKKRTTIKKRASVVLPVPLVEKKLTAEGQVATVTMTLNTSANTTDPVASATTLDASVELLGDGNALKTEVTVPSVFDEKRVSAEKPVTIPERFRASVPTETISVVDAATTAEVPTLTEDQISVVKDRITEHKVRTTITTIDTGSAPELKGQKQGVWGVEKLTLSLEESETITPSHGTKDVETNPLSAGLFLKEELKYPDSPATLTEYRTDEETGLIIKMVKTLVDPTSALPAASVQSLVERQALDKWHSIQIVSSRATADDLPASETYSSIARISLPNFLEAVGIYWEQDVDTGADADGVIGANDYPENKSWSLGATAKASAQVSGAGWVKIKNGYNGPANASVTRTYHNGPPTTTHTIHKFIPVTGQLIIQGQSRRKHGSSSKGGVGSEAYTQGSGSSAGWGRRVQYMMIPEVEHNNPTVSISGSASATSTANASAGSIPGGGTYPAASATAIATGSYQLILPASSVPKVSGNTYIHDVNVSKWRFGIWVKEVITVTVP